jgi:hypothetical protein
MIKLWWMIELGNIWYFFSPWSNLLVTKNYRKKLKWRENNLILLLDVKKNFPFGNDEFASSYIREEI